MRHLLPMISALCALFLWSAQAQAICTKDTDCKGDRICVEGACTAPDAANQGQLRFLCGYDGAPINPATQTKLMGFSSNEEAARITKEILDTMGLVANFVVQSGMVPNAAAAIQYSQRFIVYNPQFIQQMNQLTGSPWAAKSIIAHEIGHHLQGHTIQPGGSRPEIELEADEYSGFVMFKLGATLAQAQLAMNKLGNGQGSATHPGRAQRLAAIAKGWNKARAKQGNGPTTTQPTTQPATTTQNTPVLRPLPDLQREAEQRRMEEARRIAREMLPRSGAFIGQCGCHGAVQAGVRPDNRCYSGYSYPQACYNVGYCQGGSLPWVVVCR